MCLLWVVVRVVTVLVLLLARQDGLTSSAEYGTGVAGWAALGGWLLTVHIGRFGTEEAGSRCREMDGAGTLLVMWEESSLCRGAGGEGADVPASRRAEL